MKIRMRLNGLLVIVALATSLNIHAQEWPPEQASSRPANDQTNRTDTRMMQHMQEMDKMGNSMTSMADVCRMMMEKEMKGRPLKVAVLAFLGTLLAAALGLFVVLEIQWIRFWGLRIKTERQNLVL